MNMSVSRLRTYEGCPLRYRFLYVDGLPERERSAASFGSSLHSALEFMYSGGNGRPRSLASVLDHYGANWESGGWDDPEAEAEQRAYGREILESYHAMHAPRFRVPYAVEYRFRAALADDVALVGACDRIDKLPSGGLEIVDYKSDLFPFTVERLERDVQLTAYALAIEIALGLPVERVTLYHLRSQTPMSTTRTVEQKEAARDRILAVAAGIRGEAFEPKRSRLCSWCEFRSLCPLWSGANAPPAAAEPFPIEFEVGGSTLASG